MKQIWGKTLQSHSSHFPPLHCASQNIWIKESQKGKTKKMQCFFSRELVHITLPSKEQKPAAHHAQVTLLERKPQLI